MNETNIEWVKNPDGSQGYTWNPITGCLNHDNGLCKGGGFPCYAYKLANTRLKKRYLEAHALPKDMGILAGSYPTTDPFYPRFWEERLKQIDRRGYFSKAQGIFVCDMGDLFGIGVPEEWTRRVLGVIDEQLMRSAKERFYLLTKQPQNLIKFSPFPENAWVGVTATNRKMFCKAICALKEIKATVKYISIEPCLERIVSNDGWIFEGAKDVPIDDAFMLNLAYINWLIIGACTGTYKDMLALHIRLHGGTPANQLMRLENGMYSLQPRIEWLREIVEAVDRAGVKVFLKDNLQPLIKWPDAGAWVFESCSNKLRQEMPE